MFNISSALCFALFVQQFLYSLTASSASERTAYLSSSHYTCSNLQEILFQSFAKGTYKIPSTFGGGELLCMGYERLLIVGGPKCNSGPSVRVET